MSFVIILTVYASHSAVVSNQSKKSMRFFDLMQTGGLVCLTPTINMTYSFQARGVVDRLRAQLNVKSKEIGQLIQSKAEAAKIEEAKAEVARIKQEIERGEQEVSRLEAERDAKAGNIGNIVADRACISSDEVWVESECFIPDPESWQKDNQIVRTFGAMRRPLPGETLYTHVDLLRMLDAVDTDKGTDIAGGRAYYLKGPGVLLNLALINYGISFLANRGYNPMHTPFFMNQTIMGQCAQLEDFNEQLYRVCFGPHLLVAADGAVGNGRGR